MENFVKRIEEEIRNEDELKKEDSKMGKIVEEPEVMPRPQRKRKMAIDAQGPQKKSCVVESVGQNEEKTVLGCVECGRRLKITNNYSCRCGNVYCIRHRFHDQHSCTFDYRRAAVAKLEAQNPKICGKKIGDFHLD